MRLNSSVRGSFLLDDKGTAQAALVPTVVFLRMAADKCVRLVWYDLDLETETNIPEDSPLRPTTANINGPDVKLARAVRCGVRMATVRAY